MPYTPVTRIVTVEFVKEARGAGYEVRVTPEHLEMRFGDSILWSVQGLPPALAARVTFRNFRPIQLAGRVVRVTKGPRKGLLKHGVRGFSTPVAMMKGKRQATADSGGADVGRWKYDICFDEHVLVDPEGEIKGPRH